MVAVRSRQRRQGDTVHARQQLDGVCRPTQLFHKRLERRVGRNVEPRRRISHFGDSRAKRVDMLGRLPLMQRERTFHLPHRLGRNAGRENRSETSLYPMKAKQASNILVDRVADPRGIGVSGEARELRDVVERVGRHRTYRAGERKTEKPWMDSDPFVASRLRMTRHGLRDSG